MTTPAGDPQPEATPVHVRAATASDIDQLTELENSAFGVEAWSRDIVLAEISRPDRRYLVVEDCGRVAGYGGVFLGVDSAEIMTVAVAASARGRGLGRRLMEALLAEAKSAQLSQVMLEVAVDSAAAIALYRSLGFAGIGQRRGYYQPSGRDALVMRLSLV
jgi:ribosomal-protein-alanine acetyltransferase